MALSQDEVRQLRTLIEREGGIKGFVDSLIKAWGQGQVEDLIQRGASAVGLSVKSWPELARILESRPNVTVDDVVSGLIQAIKNRDQNLLTGALLASASLLAERRT